tara:strand:- start:900 stop:1685 length:786 start_codon:yes stop_codon:yes gene_type:complete
MNKLVRQKTEINIKKHDWITKDELVCPKYKQKFHYYWTGLTNNKLHKFRYLTLKAKLGILKTQIIAMVGDLYAMIQEQEHSKIEQEHDKKDEVDEVRLIVRRSSREINCDSSMPKCEYCSDDSDNSHNSDNSDNSDDNNDFLVNDDIIGNFKILDSLLQEYHDLIWNTRAPMDTFLDTYIEKRNRACYVKPHTGYTMKSPKDNKLKLRMDDLNCMITEFEVMTDFIKMSIDTNDDMPFKVFLLFLNMLTVLGEFVWNRYYK